MSAEKLIDFAQALVRIPSLSCQEGDVAKRVEEEMEGLGFDEITLDVKRLPPGRTSILFGLDPLGGGLDLSRVVTGCVDVIVR